jgi:hypothetical protein
MAVYQYLLYVIPLQSVQERFEEIPNNIFISQDVSGENLFSSDQEYKPRLRIRKNERNLNVIRGIP